MNCVIVTLLIIISFTYNGCNQATTNKLSDKTNGTKTARNRNEKDSINFNHAKVKRVIDGDTFELENGERVRLLGIDTPEKYDSKKMEADIERSQKDKGLIKRLGELSSFYSDSILFGKYVKLVSDSTNSNRDRYSRLLRYVYLENGEMFNLKIIQDGYAYAYTKYPFIHIEKFRKAEHDARENNLGLWGNIDFNEMK